LAFLHILKFHSLRKGKQTWKDHVGDLGSESLIDDTGPGDERRSPAVGMAVGKALKIRRRSFPTPAPHKPIDRGTKKEIKGQLGKKTHSVEGIKRRI
jgi:hypothetical protein